MHIIGHQEAEDILLRADLNRSQSFLLEGQRGIGKAGLALKYASHILGNAEKVKARSHSDFLVIERRTDEKSGKEKKEIVVDDARELGSFLALTPAEGSHRVAIVDSADQLNTQAANAILKLVEEPPKRSIIILLSHGGHVLPTIRSRCITLRLKPLPEKEMRQIISNIMLNVTETDIDILMQISEGSPGIAQMIYDNDGLWILGELAEIISHFPRTEYMQITKFADRLDKSDSGWEVFGHIFEWALNLIAKRAASGEPITMGHTTLHKQINIPFLLDKAAEWKNIRTETEIFNLDKKQIISQFLLGCAEIVRN